MQTVCGLANPLTSAVPESDHAKVVALVFAVASLGITSVIVGIVGSMALCEETIDALETQLERWRVLVAAGALRRGGIGGGAAVKVAPATATSQSGTAEDLGDVTHTNVEQCTVIEAERRDGCGDREDRVEDGGVGGMNSMTLNRPKISWAHKERNDHEERE